MSRLRFRRISNSLNLSLNLDLQKLAHGSSILRKAELEAASRWFGKDWRNGSAGGSGDMVRCTGHIFLQARIRHKRKPLEFNPECLRPAPSDRRMFNDGRRRMMRQPQTDFDPVTG